MLINCAAYSNGKKIADSTVLDIKKSLDNPEAFVWVALKDANEDELRELQSVFGLHDLAIEDALKGHQRPKMEEYGQIVFVVMHILEVINGDLQVGEVSIFAGPNFVLSVRSKSANGFLGVRKRCEDEPHLLSHGVGFVFYALIDAVVDRYFPILDEIETELDEIEAKIFELGSAKANIARLYGLKMKVNTLRHAVAPSLEVASKLHGGRVPKVCLSTQEYFRDVHDHLARINSTIDAIRDTIGTAIQVNLSMVAIEESETTKKLASWAAIFCVPTAMAGVWGMNFKYMPELDWKFGYPTALTSIAIASYLLWRHFRKMGWI